MVGDRLKTVTNNAQQASEPPKFGETGITITDLHDGDRDGPRVPILEVSVENNPGKCDSSYP